MSPISQGIFAPSVAPAQRFVTYVDGNSSVFYVSETETTKAGTSFTGEWQSATLNRQDQGRLWTLGRLVFYYYAEGQANLDVGASSDGGTNWIDRTVTLEPTGTDAWQVVVGFNVTGEDIRIRFRFTDDIRVKIIGFRPFLIPRGRADIGAVIINPGQLDD